MEDEIFQEVKEEDFPKVLNILKKDWPEHFLLYQTITVFEEYKKAGSKWKQNLYVYGDFVTGAYLRRIFVEYPNRKLNYFYIYTTNLDLTKVTKALMETKIIPWHTKEYMLEMIPHRMLNMIQKVLASKCVKCEARTNILLVYPRLKDLHMRPVPEDVYIDTLDESHAAEVDRNWPHRHTGSKLMLLEHIRNNFGLGVFRKSDKKLLSSAVSTYTGGLSVLFTDPHFRRRGYAIIVTQHMVQECRKRDMIPFCAVLFDNKSSLNMCLKVGFEPFTEAEYFFPPNYFS